MKQKDIKQLERAIQYYEKAERCLEGAYESLDNQPTEYFQYTASSCDTVTHLVHGMLVDAIKSRKYIEGKVRVYKEDFVDKN